MNREALKTKIEDIVSNELGVEVQSLEEETSLVNDCGMDSLDAVELTRALEEEYEIEIPDADAEKIKTIKDILDYLETKIQVEKE